MTDDAEKLHIADELKKREQGRDFEGKKHLLASEKYVELLHRERMQAREYSKDYGTAAIKSLFLLNGGSILSFMTFVGAIYSKAEATQLQIAKTLIHNSQYGLIALVVGLVFAAATSAIGYLNFGALEDCYSPPRHLYTWILGDKPPDPPNRFPFVRRTYYLGVALASTSLACFIFGAFMIGRALYRS